MHHIKIGSDNKPTVVYAHGWARSHRDFIPVAEALAPVAHSVLLDLPGFGETQRPADAWGTRQYADHLAEFVKTLPSEQVIFVGHSLGGRIGLRLAVHHESLFSAMVLVSAHGVSTPRPAWKTLEFRCRRAIFKLRKRLAKDDAALDALEARYGSADYIASKESGLRDILIKVIEEDQTPDLGRIRVPVKLLYGANDVDTSPALGRKIAGGIAGAEYIECPEFDHISILDRGRHQIALAIKEFLFQAECVKGAVDQGSALSQLTGGGDR